MANNFIDNGTVSTTGNALPSTKSNVPLAPALPAAQSLSANDVNTLTGALTDVKTVIVRSVSIMSFAGADPTGATDNSAAITLALAALSSGGVLHFPVGTYRLSANLIIPANVTVAFDSSMISVDTGITLTINGSIDAPVGVQIFEGVGTTLLGTIGDANSTGIVSVKWFGAQGDASTDDTAAIQAAVVAAEQYMESTAGATAGTRQRVFFPRGVYNVSTALIAGAFADLFGEQAILVGTNPANNILHLTGYHARINGMTFQGGLNALYVDNGDDDVNHVWVSECEFDGQNGAALADNNSASTLVAFDKCLFYQAVTGATAFNVATLRINASNCQFYWGTATCFNITGAVYLRVSDSDGIPLGGNTQWINVAGAFSGGAQLYFDKFRFGGESPSSICTWSGPPVIGDEPGVLSIERSELYSSGLVAFTFNSLPATLTLDNNTGDLSLGVLYATGMNDDNFIWEPIFRKQVEHLQTLAQGGYASATDRVLIADERLQPAFHSSSGQPKAADLVYIATGASLSFVTNPNVTPSSGTNSFGGTLLVGTSTATAASATTAWGTDLAPPLASLAAGLYTAAIELELVGPASITTGLCGNQRNYNLPTGRYVLCAPFVIDPLQASPSAWGTSTAYSVGDYVANFGDIFKCVVAGTSASGGSGPAIDEPGTSITDGNTLNTTIASGSNNVALPTGTINVGSTTGFASSGTIAVQLLGIGQYALVSYTGKTSTTFTGCTGGSGLLVTGSTVTQGGVIWLCVGDQGVNLGWTPVATGAVVRIGALRIFSGRYDIKTVNTIGVNSAAPSTGTWQVGDRFDFGAPAAGGQIGTVCVTAGTPGTWKSFGTISS